MAKPPKRKRDPLDAYYTPDWPIRRFLTAVKEELLQLMPPDSFSFLCFLEPCAGDGAIAKVLREFFPGHGIHCNDIDPRAVAQLEAAGFRTSCCDALDMFEHEFSLSCCSAVITNPPWHRGFPLRLVRKLMTREQPPDFVAILGRLTLLETPSRAAFFLEYPPHVYILPERVSHTGDGASDNVGEAWFVFRQGQTDSRLFWLTDDFVQPRLQLDGEP